MPSRPFPPVPDRRLAVRIAPDALRQVRGGHPWVYDRSIRSGGDGGVAGQLAVIFDDRRRFAAVGLWDPSSPIRLRVLHRDQGRPVDAAFWRERIDAALALRSQLFDDAGTTGFRLVHGENDGLGGLIVDRYADTLVVKVYSEAWLPHLRTVVEQLAEAVSDRGVPVERIVGRISRSLRGQEVLADGDVLTGRPVDGVIPFLECGLEFEADVVAGQKTGHFLDQRENRAAVARRSAGASVLDVFAATGGFSVHAAAGGALDVTSVDLSPRSLRTAESNWARNLGRPAVAAARHRTVVGDAFEVMSDLARRRRSYDIVVVDPPSFAHRARDTERAVAAYRRLATLGASLVAPGGTYVQSSCSSHVDESMLSDAVSAGTADAGLVLRDVQRTGHPADHPVGFAQGAYLSTILGRPSPA